jgi:hypothetical protein
VQYMWAFGIVFAVWYACLLLSFVQVLLLLFLAFCC